MLPSLAGNTPVIISAYLEHDGKIHVAAGQLFAHCADCAKTFLDGFNSWLGLRDREPAPGELIDLPPVSAAPVPPRARWLFPRPLPHQEIHMLNATDDPPPVPPDDPEPKKDDDKKPADDE
jgi:hypothetical protein